MTADDPNPSDAHKKRPFRSRTGNQPANERRILFRGETGEIVAQILLLDPDTKVSLFDFYDTFRKLCSKGKIAKWSESAIRGVLGRLRDAGFLETNQGKQLHSHERLYRLTGKGQSVLREALGPSDDKDLRSQKSEVLDALPSTPPTAPNQDQGSLLIEPRFLRVDEIMDLKAARYENVKLQFRPDLHIGRLIHEACERGPGRRDRSKKKSHSEESFTLFITKDAWVRLIPKRADFPGKLVQWLQSAKINPLDVLRVWTDLMNQSTDVRAILEIPAKWRLPDGESFLVRVKHEGKVWDIEYVRSHGGEYEVRSPTFRSQMNFMTIFGGTAAAAWPQFSDLMDSVREQVQSMKEELQSSRQDLENSTIEKVRTLEEDVKKLRRVIEQLLELATHGPSAEAKGQDEKPPDYIA